MVTSNEKSGNHCDDIDTGKHYEQGMTPVVDTSSKGKQKKSGLNWNLSEKEKHASRNRLQRRTEQLVSFVPKDQPMYELRVVLDTEGDNLKWSRKKSQQIEMKNGTLCNIQIINSEKKVWEVLVNKTMDTIDNIKGN